MKMEKMKDEEEEKEKQSLSVHSKNWRKLMLNIKYYENRKEKRKLLIYVYKMNE